MSRGLLLVALMFMIGCPKILVKPQANSVKKIAIVSFFMNREIYNLAVKEQPTLKEAIGKSVAGAFSDDRNRALTELITHGYQSYSANLAGAGWEVLPMEQVVATPGLKAFMPEAATQQVEGAAGELLKGVIKIAQGQWESPVGVPIIPLEQFSDPAGTTSFGSGKKEKAEARKKLAALCQELGVDAVALIQLDAAYAPTKGITFIFGKNSTKPARPSISGAMVVVTKDGEVAARTRFVEKNGGTRYTGDKSRMLLNDQVELERKQGKVLADFKATIDMAAASLKKQILKENKK